MILSSDGVTSSKIKREFIGLLDKPVEETRVLVIYTLRKKRHIKYLRNVNSELKKLGIKKNNIIYANISNNLKKPKNNFDVIYSCGGNTFYILNRIRKTGFDKLIKDFVNKGGLYFGVSAGSIIVHKTIKFVDYGKEGDINDIHLKNLNGLNLTNIWISPHFRKDLASEIVEIRKKLKFPVKGLKDGQALVILAKKKSPAFRLGFSS